MAHYQTHSPPTVESIRAACSPPHSAGSSFRCSDPRLQRERRQSLPAHSTRRQAVQSGQTPSQDQGQARHHQTGPLFRRRRSGDRHTEEVLRRFIDYFAHACDEFSLTISIKKTEVMELGTESPMLPPPPSIYIGSHKLNVVNWFQYLVSTISSKLSLESETNSRIAKASAVMSKLHKGCSPTTT